VILVRLRLFRRRDHAILIEVLCFQDVQVSIAILV